MSNLLKQSVQGPLVRPRPTPISTPTLNEVDDSSSSDSSASSAASIATVRPSSREQPAPDSHWTKYFDQELFLENKTDEVHARYHVYLTVPANPAKGPLFICHHGAGASGLSFAVFAQELHARLPEAGILSLEARGHGSVVTDATTGAEITDYSLATLTADAEQMIRLTAAQLNWPLTALPPSVLVGHSLGGAIVATLAAEHWKLWGARLIGYSVIDVVEGSALEALTHMRTYLASRPRVFATDDEAISWHTRSRTLRDTRSAAVSVPSLLVPAATPPGARTWRTDLAATAPWWEGWFVGLSKKFLAGKGAKQLILAGTDRLDRELMIGQMQGKFQLVVLPEAGHFVQEDVPAKTADLLVEFFRRNDRSQMVLPPKVSELLAQGKKV